MRHLLITTALLMPASLWAQDMALLLGQERYEQLDRVRGADDIARAIPRLEVLGFEVLSRTNGRDPVVRDLAAAFQTQSTAADRLVVGLSGHFVTDGTRNWLLTAEAETPDMFDVDAAALSLESVLSVLATKPGKAVLLLGQADPRDLDMSSSSLSAGLSDLRVPQGVTVLRTNPAEAARILAGPLTQPEGVIGTQLLNRDDLATDGFLPADWALMPSEVIVDPVSEPDPAAGPTDDALNQEAQLWDTTTALDTVEGYRTYLSRYPQGRFVDDAEEQIAAILSEPNRDARLAEEALNLTRQQRRDIQADLTLLAYDTRGVDGIFGSGSRSAIINWQQSSGYPQTSYLTRDQIGVLDAQAARRQAEIEAEEARALAAAQARDRAYWAETGALGDAPGYSAYLERYPEGLFANIATAALSEIEDSRRAEAAAADRAAWDAAEDRDTLEGYRAYLALYPEGEFAEIAQSRVADLNAPQVAQSQRDQAQAEEAGLRLSGVRAQLLELRLRDLGLDAGPLDGVIDDTTRDAIRSYQEAQGIAPTGFVDRRTAIGLITGGGN